MEEKSHAECARIIESRKKAQIKNEEKYRENSKQQLISIIEKKFKTTMIGALARFEDKFGELWGHGKTKVSQTEAEWRELWEEVRTEILNNGNNQLRAALEELATYTIAKAKYRTDFIVRSEVKSNVDVPRQCLETERKRYERRND